MSNTSKWTTNRASRKGKWVKCRNCGFGTTQLHELETPIHRKHPPLPIYAVCATCKRKRESVKKQTKQ